MVLLGVPGEVCLEDVDWESSRKGTVCRHLSGHHLGDQKHARCGPSSQTAYKADWIWGNQFRLLMGGVASVYWNGQIASYHHCTQSTPAAHLSLCLK